MSISIARTDEREARMGSDIGPEEEREWLFCAVIETLVDVRML
jgi:hypothetical protein